MTALPETLVRQQNALTSLEGSWRDASGRWTDQKSRTFEADHFTPILAAGKRYQNALDSLTRIALQVSRELEF